MDQQLEPPAATEPRDHEKGSNSNVPDEGEWNLETVLRGLHDQDLESGIRQKRLSVLWEDLSVKGVSGESNVIPTIPHAFLRFLFLDRPLRRLLDRPRTRRSDAGYILRGLTGLAKPGEMVLVLGKPGAGCST